MLNQLATQRTLPFAIVALLALHAAPAGAGIHWGDITAKGCVSGKTGLQLYSAILWDIPSGASWEKACRETKATINHVDYPEPTRCITKDHMWGEWDVPDMTCGPLVTSDPFTLVIASDTQVWSWHRNDHAVQSKSKKVGDPGDGCQIGETYHEKCSQAANEDQFSAMGKVQMLRWPDTPHVIRDRHDKPVPRPVGVAINGDLTEFFHPRQIDEFQRLIDRHKEDLLGMQLLLGLGNHDYFNNLCDCRGHSPFDSMSCARNAVYRMHERYGNAGWIVFDKNSSAYSFDFGNYHFAQLNLTPIYEVQFDGLSASGAVGSPEHQQCLNESRTLRAADKGSYRQIASGLPWLTSDLTEAQDKRIVLFMHAANDPGYWSNQRAATAFRELLAKVNVVAIFAGHYHGLYGDQTKERTEWVNKAGQKIPLFLSGSSEYRKFLVAEFGETYLIVGVVDSTDGKATFFSSANQEMLRSYP